MTRLIENIIADINALKPGEDLTVDMNELYKHGHSIDEVLTLVSREEFNWEFDVSIQVVRFERA